MHHLGGLQKFFIISLMILSHRNVWMWIQYDHENAEFPYVLTLFAKDDNSSLHTYVCLSVYIALTWSITPVSCYDPKRQNYVLIGGRATKDSFSIDNTDDLHGELRYVRKWITYENFTPSDPYSNNLALLHIDKVFTLNAFVQYIALYSYAEMGYGCDPAILFNMCTMVAFVEKHESNKLRKINVKISRLQECNESYIGNMIEVNFNNTCTLTKNSSLISNTNGTCVGEIGSGLLCRKKIIAIMLQTFECSDVHTALFLKVDAFQNWLDNRTDSALWYENVPLILCRHSDPKEDTGVINISVKRNVMVCGVFLMYLIFCK